MDSKNPAGEDIGGYDRAMKLFYVPIWHKPMINIFDNSYSIANFQTKSMSGINEVTTTYHERRD